MYVDLLFDIYADEYTLFRKITEGEVDEIWLAYLTELNKKMTYVKRNQKKNIKAIKDVGPELEKLRLKVWNSF